MTQTGDIVDRYRLTDHIGSGTFGEVWKANRLADGKDDGFTCALKLMKLTYERAGSSPRTLASGWLEEVRNLVRVAGKTVPCVYEADVWNDYAYIAMEFLDGSTLRTRIDQGQVSWRRALFVAEQISTALEAAHELGIIHRDLKPQNVILVDSGRVCVIDWGIARTKAVSGAAGHGVAVAPRATMKMEATDPGSVVHATPPPQTVLVGTPGYMAPEAYERVRSAPAHDVYSLGVVLYEMIAGCLPHAVERLGDIRGPDSIRAYRSALDKATMDYALIPLRERCPDVPKGVAQLVDSLLARDPDRRPRQLRKAIEVASRFPYGVPDPPYVGLGEMGPEHAGLYFGQQDTVQHILDRLKVQRGVVLRGPSGSGKSSLALAGVAATMDRTLFLETDGWDVHVVRPMHAQGFRAVSDVASSSGTTIGKLVVIDQLEEVVDLNREWVRLFHGTSRREEFRSLDEPEVRPLERNRVGDLAGVA